MSEKKIQGFYFNATEFRVAEQTRLIVTYALEGKSIGAIQESLKTKHNIELGLATISLYLKKALEEARDMFLEQAEGLLAKTYVRTELLIDLLMERVNNTSMQGEIDYAAIDRLDKLFNTQVRMLTGIVKTRRELEQEKPRLFNTSQEEYIEIIDMMRSDENFDSSTIELEKPKDIEKVARDFEGNIDDNLWKQI